jgi:hypothetical protein
MKTFVNLLPLEYRREKILRRRAVQWSVVWAGCLAAAAGAWWLKHDHERAALQVIRAAEQRYLPLEKLNRQGKAMQTELGELRAKGTVLRQLREDRPLVTLIGLASRSARQCNGRLVVRNMVFERKKSEADKNTGPPGPPKQEPQEPAAEQETPWASVTFEGEALDNLAIATFVAALRDTGLFRRVELKSSIGSKSPDTQAHAYSVECDI